MKRSKRWFLQIFINEIKNRLIPRNMYKTFELLRTSRSGFNQSSPNRREMMKTATYNVQTCDGTSQDITINYTIVPEPLSVIREWCEMNSFRSFDCIPENKMARDNFAWSYISHVENGLRRDITCTARRMTWYSSRHLNPNLFPTFSFRIGLWSPENTEVNVTSKNRTCRDDVESFLDVSRQMDIDRWLVDSDVWWSDPYDHEPAYPQNLMLELIKNDAQTTHMNTMYEADDQGIWSMLRSCNGVVPNIYRDSSLSHPDLIGALLIWWRFHQDSIKELTTLKSTVVSSQNILQIPKPRRWMIYEINLPERNAEA